MFFKLTKRLVLALCATALLASCNLEYFADAQLEPFTWNPSLAIPIGEISYSVEDLFEELSDAGVNIGENSDDIVTLTYEQTLQSQSASGFLSIADQNFGQSADAGLNINAQGFSSQHNFSEVFEFDLAATQNEEYDSVNFSGGNIDIDMSSELDAEVAFTLTIKSLVRNANASPLVVTGTLTPSNSSINVTEPLNQFLGDFSRDANDNAVRNKVVITLDYQVNVSPTSVIQPTDGVSFSMNLLNPEFDLVYGFVGERQLDVNFELLNLDFFDSFREGTISFAEPRFSFVFDNSFGFPLGVAFNNIAAVTQQGQIIPLTGSAATTVGTVNGPEISAIGSSVNTVLELNSTNSNLPELISSMPKRVIIEVNAEANPATAPAQYNFVDASSELNVGVSLELPMIVNINGLVSTERVDFDVAEGLDQAKKLTLRLITENDLPLGGELELAFIDGNGNTVLNVSERAFFDAAPVGSDGRTDATQTRVTDIAFDDDEIRLIENAVFLDVITRLTTTDASTNQSVRFFSDYKLKVKLAAQADVEITN